MNVGMGLVPERDRLIDTRHPGPEGQVHRASRGTAAARTGATTGSKGNHEHQREANDGKLEREAAHPGKRGENLHHLMPPFVCENKKLPSHSRLINARLPAIPDLQKTTYELRTDPKSS